MALRNDGSSNSSKALIESTEKLLAFLKAKCQRTDGVFDEKLADYVFFPLSQILQRKQKYNDSLSEVTIKCLNILLQYGWRKRIALDLAKQLLILLTFVAGGVPGQKVEPVPEELMVDAFTSLEALFKALGGTPGGATSLVEADTIPALGHCVTVILDGITHGPSVNTQIQALHALDTVWRCVKDLQALSTFLPGTISALTKCLMPSTNSRRSRKTIIIALEVLEHVLVTILSDIRTRNIKDEVPSTEKKTLTKPWLQATTSQIKLALSNVIRLRTHDSEDVRVALQQLCLTILDQCHNNFLESASMLVETCMSLSDIDEKNTDKISLTNLATIHSDLGELVKGTVYNWVTSLPRVMQSNDETSKRVALSQLSNAHKILTDLNLDSSILEDALINSLRDSVTVTIETSALVPVNGVQEAEFDLNSQAAMALVSEKGTSTSFRPIIMPEQSRRETRNQLTQLLGGFGTRQAQIKMASDMLEYARGCASGSSILSAFWLSSQLLKSATSQNTDLDEFFSASVTSSDDQEIVNQELFSFSLSVLSSPSANSDWRMQAVALEVIAATSQNMKEGFRTELVDALYPIAQHLGSPVPQIREHAITCLNLVSNSCGYTNASELIIKNVDYLVNAISLRLNTFDISPQAPQVLVMMIRLTGPSLLLYLDDVVSSIFAALDNFHGYARLVEVLFSVLSEIVTVGAQSNNLLLPSTLSSHLKMGPDTLTLDDITKSITKKPFTNQEPLPHEPVPEKPWKDAKTLLDEAEEPPPEDSDEGPPPEIARPPPTKTYTMLQNITRLGQHYLTNQSPVLRAKLLSLISKASRSLQHDSDAFLPLINDIWPVIVHRLYDEEPFVAIAATETVSELCRSAGDFLASRIKDEFPQLIKLAKLSRAKFEGEQRGGAGRGVYSQPSKAWEAIIRLLVTIVGYVNLDDDTFDQIIGVLGRVLERQDVRGVLERINADAVWLALHQLGTEGAIQQPAVDGYAFAELSTGILHS